MLLLKPLLKYLTPTLLQKKKKGEEKSHLMISVLWVLSFDFTPTRSLGITHVVFVLCSRLHLNKKATDKQPYSKLPGVSLLKPLKGVDPNLINNLETFFELDYPKVSVVLAVPMRDGLDCGFGFWFFFSFLIRNIGNFNTAYKAEVLMLSVRKIKVRFACNKEVGRFSSPYSLFFK